MIPAQEIRFAFRTFRKSPWFTTVLVLILAIGIGANTAMFTLVSNILLKPLPSPEGHRIMHIGTNNLSKGQPVAPVSYSDFLDWRAQSRSFSDMGLLQFATFNVSDGVTAAEPVGGARLSANAFRLLRMQPARGRDFRPGEDQPGAQPVVILGYGIWMSRYGGDPGVIGRTVRVDDSPATIIGVMPEGMRFPASADIWMPLVRTAALERRDVRQCEAFGRLRDGVSLEEARAETELLGRRLETEYPDSNRGVRPAVTPYTQRAIAGQMRLVLVSLQFAVGFLMLVVCANAANLLLSRSVSRSREIAIRSALGAGRLALVRQLLIESVLYAALGGLLGSVLAYGGVRAFDAALSAIGRPYWLTFAMDLRVLAFLALVVLLTGVLFGLAPALASLRTSVNEPLKESADRGGTGKSAHRMAGGFVIAQVSLTLVLLVGFGLLARSIVNIYAAARGFDDAPVLTMRLRLPDARYRTADERRRFQERLLSAVRELPGVETVALASHLPLAGSDPLPIEPEGYPLPADGKPAPVATLVVSPEYFRTLGIRLVAGRQFTASDGAPGQANGIVNQQFAAKYWPGQVPLGKRLRITRGEDREWLTVIGVSANVRQNQASAKEPAAVLYLPARSVPEWSFLLTVRTSVPPEAVSRAVRDRIRVLDAGVPVSAVMSMREVFRLAHWPHRVFGSMFAVFGIVAAALAGLGVYSVMAYSVALRTREIGLRVALGATGADIQRMVLARGVRQAALALALGLTGALVVTRGLRALLVQVSAADPLTYLGAGTFLAVLALLACWLPARRASAVDPLQALRQQ